ncbi:MAG: helix-turn-helix transcriptional regulator [Alistipes sp.]|nr:helix-turn-helix transcriptional regulator [Alistipes sp.]
MSIICKNTLSGMALRSLLYDLAPSIDVVCYGSVEELIRSNAHVAHYFVSADILFHNAEYFQPYMRRTIVLVEGEASPFVQSGYRTIDITASEQHIVRAIMEIHRVGHPMGQHPHVSPAAEHSSHEQAQLSSRERDVLRLVVKGYINKEIADKLNISLATVIFHRNNISEKLQTRSIGRLTIYAVLNNIVQLSDI